MAKPKIKDIITANASTPKLEQSDIMDPNTTVNEVLCRNWEKEDEQGRKDIVESIKNMGRSRMIDAYVDDMASKVFISTERYDANPEFYAGAQPGNNNGVDGYRMGKGESLYAYYSIQLSDQNILEMIEFIKSEAEALAVLDTWAYFGRFLMATPKGKTLDSNASRKKDAPLPRQTITNFLGKMIRAYMIDKGIPKTAATKLTKELINLTT